VGGLGFTGRIVSGDEGIRKGMRKPGYGGIIDGEEEKKDEEERKWMGKMMKSKMTWMREMARPVSGQVRLLGLRKSRRCLVGGSMRQIGERPI
jgi:hypothetical protein